MPEAPPPPASAIRPSDGPTRIECLRLYLSARAHPPSTIRAYVRCAQHFERWLAATAPAQALPDEGAAQAFVTQHLSACSCPPPAPTHPDNVRAALNHLLVALRSHGLIPPPSAPPPTHLSDELGAFERHLIETCGAAPQTRIYRLRYAEEFLSELFATGPVDHGAISPRVLMTFVAARAEGHKPGTMKVIASSLRSYLRFLVLRGAGGRCLVDAVPTTPYWRLSSVPRALTDEEREALLASFDPSTVSGSRDYAIALCLSELGLRTQEVVGLTLGSVNWRNGCIRIDGGKTRRERVLPLSRRVGDAIATYLRVRAPRSASRALFLRHTVPAGTPVTAEMVRGIIRRACTRVGILPPRAGPHVLRHTAATRMLRHGIPLAEIADVLGHECIDTTAIYAKVDLLGLTRAALPWPGGPS